MTRRVQQFRYYGDKETNNQPTKLEAEALYSGSIFDDYAPIKQIGIQTMPGVKFYLNNSPEPVIVGFTGIYELDMENMAEITALSFDIESVDMINDSSSAYLIIDILYEEGVK